MRRGLRRGGASLILVLLGGAARVAAQDQVGAATPDLGAASLKAIGALVLVLALIILIAFLARRYLPFVMQSQTRGNQIQLLSMRALGPKRSIHLVQVEGRRFLLGSSDAGVNLLRDFGSSPSRGDDQEKGT